ncbi:MAG: hypothetical protein KGS72_03505 [Cyanobacteria bacterium REEB67]|nr:hypothetical protein [Cyanobacteria bacterium REEB67]
MPRTVSKSISAGANNLGRLLAGLLSLSALLGAAAAGAPTAQIPAGQKSTTAATPAAQKPVAQKPAAAAAATPTAQKPVAQKPAAAATPTAQKPVAQKPAVSATTTMQVKKLDDSSNKEVLRPIPAVLKNPPATAAQTPPKTNPQPAARANPVGAAKESIQSKDAAGKTTAPTGATGATGAKDIAGKKAQADDKQKNKVRKSANLGSHFVPPPPPTTPTMLGDADFGMYSGMPVEMLSKEALKDRAKEISIQYKDASRELEDRSREKEEKIQRAKEFEGLFQEGVVSKRELEASQREAGTVNSDIDRLTFKANELKGLLDRINKRLAPQAAKKRRAQLIN